ncbi:MAG TPA: aminopeptidase P family protein [Clostridiales bacterium]|nr:aminopeptidase P family protein [Clostridiales bacterium]
MKNYNIEEIKAMANSYNKKDVYRKKVLAFQKAMQDKSIDGVICLKPQNTFYFSGFNPVLYSHPVIVVIPAEGEIVLLVHALRAEHAKLEACVDDIRLFASWGTQKSIAQNAYDALKIICDDLKLTEKHIGIEGDFLSLKQHKTIIDKVIPKQVTDVSDILLSARMIKDEYEICMLKLAGYLTNVGMQAAIEHIRESEIAVSAAAEIAMRKAWERDLPEYEMAAFGNTEGGIINALWCYSLSGYRVANACDCPTARVPKDGEICLPVVWAVCNGYHAENEKTVIIGNLDDYYMKMYDSCMEARKRAVKTARAGVKIKDLYNAAVSAFIEAGQGDNLPGRIGHGMGQSLHEEPSLSKNSDMTLQNGMVVTLEPGLCFPGWGEIRHSDTFVIRENCAEPLTFFEDGNKIVR